MTYFFFTPQLTSLLKLQFGYVMSFNLVTQAIDFKSLKVCKDLTVASIDSTVVTTPSVPKFGMLFGKHTFYVQ